VNIAALLGTSGIMPEQMEANVPIEETDVDFKQVLQTLVTSGDLEMGDTPDGSPNWLGFLLKYFDAGSMTPVTTPDPTGEALETATGERQVSLTELMAVLHPLVSVGGGDTDQPAGLAGSTADDTAENRQLTAEAVLFGNGTETVSASMAAVGLTETAVPVTVVPPQTTPGSVPVTDQSAATPANANNLSQAVIAGAPESHRFAGQTAPNAQQTPVSPTDPAATTSSQTAQPSAPAPLPTTTREPAAGNAGIPNTGSGDNTPTAKPVSFADNMAQANAPVAGTARQPVATGMETVANRPEVVTQTAQPTTSAANTGSQVFTSGEQPVVQATANQAALPTAAAVEGSSAKPANTGTNSTADSMAAGATVETAEFKPVSAQAATAEVPKPAALQQIVESVRLLVQKGDTQVRLQLYPKELGQVLVQLQVTADGELSVRMLAESTQAHSLIQEHLPQLRSLFSSQGLQVGTLNVNVGSDSSGFNSDTHQPGDSQNFNDSQSGPNHRSNRAAVADAPHQRPVSLGNLSSIDFHA
jgi:flagellar hook-length control protein FliK